MNKLAIVPGSLADASAQDGCSLAESFIGADAVIIVDVSGSMGAKDSRGGQSRYVIACEELARLQANLPGRCAVIAFSSQHRFSPGGVPVFLGGGTNLAGALRFARLADVEGVEFYVISDGQPDNQDEALLVARTIKAPIHTIYVGPEGGGGLEFLARLAAANGGKAEVDFKVAALAEKVERLMLA